MSQHHHPGASELTALELVSLVRHAIPDSVFDNEHERISGALEEITQRLHAAAPSAPAWIACSERMPSNARAVFVQTDEGFVHLAAWVRNHWDSDTMKPQEVVVAWHELPAPYPPPAPPERAEP